MPHLATWLNGERWDDEIQQPSSAGHDLRPADAGNPRLTGNRQKDDPMNYEQRTKAIGAWLQKELQSYDVPANHTPERAATEMTAMVEDINSEIVSSINEEGLTNILRNMGKDIRKNNRTRSWPTIYNMVKAAQKCSDAYKPPILGPSKSVAWDSDAIECQTHEPRGEPVAETYITGSGADRLLEKNLVTMNVIQMYRQSLEENRIETYARREQPADPIEDYPF